VGHTKPYLLTPTARRHLRESRAWSISRWGRDLTEEYFTELHEAAIDLAKNHSMYRTREELAGGTGLFLFPFRE